MIKLIIDFLAKNIQLIKIYFNKIYLKYIFILVYLNFNKLFLLYIDIFKESLKVLYFNLIVIKINLLKNSQTLIFLVITIAKFLIFFNKFFIYKMHLLRFYDFKDQKYILIKRYIVYQIILKKELQQLF